jgi:2-polyprenyl-6-methoxyphenol hydroxylase-like FAD-dependent oxidoreductase
MDQSSNRDTEVLIIGAGPTGLVLALWLTHFGVHVRIIDKTAEPGTTSRALAVQSRTLELYNQIGLADEVVKRGRKVTAVNLWVEGKKAAHAVIGDFGAGISPFSFALVFPQDDHERLLIERLAALGVNVERQTELVDFQEVNNRVRSRLKLKDGSTETCEAAYIAGCDGAHSVVREQLKIGFPGGTYSHLFYVADVEASGEVMNGELHAGLEKTEFLIVFPLVAEGRVRLVGTMREDPQDRRENLTWSDVNKRVLEWMRLDIKRVNWFSTYRVHHRVADHFQNGRAFLMGDAAHVHSPVGGQGMNTGIGDAINCAWKFAAVLQGRADASLLDTYEPERIAFARRLVATTDRAFTEVTSASFVARLVRLKIVPLLMPYFFKLNAARRLMFRTVSQTQINYRASALSEGRAGSVLGGDRLPWVKIASNGGDEDNFAPLTSLDWQVHLYGDAVPEVKKICESLKIPLRVFAWIPEMARAGLQRYAIYLIRPDGYIGMVDPRGEARSISAYLDKHNLRSSSSKSPCRADAQVQ